MQRQRGGNSNRGGRGGGGGDRAGFNGGASRGGGGGSFRGGRGGGGGGRQAPPSETWNLPPLGKQSPLPKLAAPPAPGALPKYNEDVFALQKPKAPGSSGAVKIECLTNYYELELGTKYAQAFFYTVKIAKREKDNAGDTGKKRPAGPPRGAAKERRLGMRLNRKVFAKVPKDETGKQMLAYDGRQRACGLKRIPNDSLVLIVELEGSRWDVSLSYEKSVPLNGVKAGQEYFRDGDNEESLLSLAIMMNHMPSIQYTPLGRGFYGLPGETPKPIGGGFECWPGYKAHVIPGSDKLFLNVNYAITTFVKPGRLIDLLPELLGLRDLPPSLQPRQVQDLKKKLFRCRFKVLHVQLDKKFTIATITNEPASNVLFVDKEGKKVSVASYFQRQYSKLKYPNYPCVQVGSDNVKHFPLEHVEIIKGNPFRGEQTPQMVSEIIRLAAIPPRNRLEEIRATVKTIRGQSELEKEFDMKLRSDELRVPARILAPPTLVASNQKVVKVTPGVIDFRNDKFFSCSKIERWSVIITDERSSAGDINDFVGTFIKQSRQTGVALGEPLRANNNAFHAVSERMSIEKAEEAIEKFVVASKLQFVLFVIGDSTTMHAAIKYTCDVKLGVASKCVKVATIRKVVNNQRQGPDQCVLNITYGLNPKFNGENIVGINTEFAQNLLSSCPTLIIGIDVNHGQAKIRDGVAKMPSTVGVVGTRNMNATLYNAYMRAQRKPPTNADKEVIQCEVLRPALERLFVGFFKATNQKPARVIVYRDGVSNGQFNAVLEKEMKTIVDVCRGFPGGEYRPPITFITVQKRHDTRLFPKQVTKDWKGNEKQNPVAGTVVDSTLTGPRVWNFFMASHEGIQGTSKPAHYNVLIDENGFSNDQLQNLTYHLCHLYGKCPRAVSLPSPVYYAHHVAFRAAELGASRFHRSAMGQSDLASHSSGETGAKRLEEDEKAILDIYNGACRVSENYAGRMYFL